MTGRTRKRPYIRPVPQWSGPEGWTLDKETPAGHSFRARYKGQHIGWVHPELDETGAVRWRWTAKKKLLARTSFTSGRFDDWRQAAAAITRSSMAHIIAGHRRHHVLPEQWVKHLLLRGDPWVPKPVPLSKVKQFTVIVFTRSDADGVQADVIDVYDGDSEDLTTVAMKAVAREDPGTPASTATLDAELEKLGFYRTKPWETLDSGMNRLSSMVASVKP
jgi:hypothetical protein